LCNKNYNKFIILKLNNKKQINKLNMKKEINKKKTKSWIEKLMQSAKIKCFKTKTINKERETLKLKSTFLVYIFIFFLTWI
jgi:hypothetical protein